MSKQGRKTGTSRRNFIRESAAVGVTLGAYGISSGSSERTSQGTRTGLNPLAREFVSRFGLKYPIVQAPTGTAASAELAIAVANAGAMGGLGLSPVRPDRAFDLVTQVRSATEGAFFVNYVLNFEPRSLDQALDAGAPTVQFSWGLPSAAMVAKIRKAGAKLGIQVAGRESAIAALELEPDYLVCQGIEAGGHVHGSRTLHAALQEVLGVATSIPVLASGGMATGHDVRAVVSSGAAGAVMGTRFVATRESAAHPDYKAALLAAGAEDTAFTVCLNRGWPATHRILRNETFTMWEAAGCPLPGSRPGEDDVVARSSSGREILRYSAATPIVGMTGNVVELGAYAGTGVQHVNDLPAAGQLVARLGQEYDETG